MLMEGALQGRKLAVFGKPLDSDDVAARRLSDRHEARAGLLAVDQHGAGAAVARIAADLGAGEAEFIAQGVRQARYGRQVERHRLAIDGETQGRAGARQHEAKLRRARRTSSSAASCRYSLVARTSLIGASARICCGVDDFGEPICRDADKRLFEFRQALRDQAAGAHRERSARDDVALDLDHRGSHGDRDHQILARAKLDEIRSRIALTVWESVAR